MWDTRNSTLDITASSILIPDSWILILFFLALDSCVLTLY